MRLMKHTDTIEHLSDNTNKIETYGSHFDPDIQTNPYRTQDIFSVDICEEHSKTTHNGREPKTMHNYAYRRCVRNKYKHDGHSLFTPNKLVVYASHAWTYNKNEEPQHCVPTDRINVTFVRVCVRAHVYKKHTIFRHTKHHSHCMRTPKQAFRVIQIWKSSTLCLSRIFAS